MQSYDFSTGEELLKICRSHGVKISEAMLRREMEQKEKSREEILSRMERSWQIMKEAVAESLEADRRSMGGLIGGEAKKLISFLESRETLLGPVVGKAIAYAMGVLEVNASMGLIVAAPTAGSSGVIPGVLLAIQEEKGLSDDEIVMALFNAGAIGYLITRNGTVSGAEGGCQAEIGSAAAMASSAVVELMGGNRHQSLNAAASVMATMLGLVCDPIGGLVEAPCQKRNGTGAVNALICAQMSMAGVGSLVPFDEMIEVVLRVGRSLPYELRETALGGIAASPTACSLCGQCG